MHDQKDYLSIKELCSKGLNVYFIGEVKKIDLWCKADDFLHTFQVSKWADRPYLNIYKIALKCYSIHTGPIYLVLSEAVWKRAIRSAKDIKTNQYHIIGKSNPYIHAVINHVNVKQYNIKVIQSFKSEQEYNDAINAEKQNDLF